MGQATSTNQTKSRVARHRANVAKKDHKRIEVTVPSQDAMLVKVVARVLRSGGKDAKRVRETLRALATSPRARTGAELVEFFRKSPLVHADLEIERDSSTGRCIDLG